MNSNEVSLKSNDYGISEFVQSQIGGASEFPTIQSVIIFLLFYMHFYFEWSCEVRAKREPSKLI